MSETIITSLIAGLCVAVPNILATILSHKSNSKKNEETKELTLYRIDQLETKVDKHNNLIDRMYKVEGEIKIVNEKITGLEKKTN